MMDAPQIKYARTSDGVNIAYYAIGEGAPYLWTTFASIADHWRVPELRELHESIAQRSLFVSYDARGFGLSDRGQVDFSCDGLVRDLEAVSDAAGLERFTLQTWGYMSIPALMFAHRHPERLQAMVLLHGIMRGADMAPAWRSLLQTAAEDWDYAIRLMAQTNEPGFALTESLAQSRRAYDRAVSQDTFVRFFRSVADWDVTQIVPGVSTPALVAHYGDVAVYYPFEASRRLAAALPNGTFATVEPAAGSQSMVDAVRPVIINYLRSVLPPEARRRRQPPVPSGTAIILFADIVDSTALTESLGDRAFREKARDLGASLRRLIREAGGTPVEGPTLGDGLLATFASAAKAIEAALACGRAGDEAGLPLHLGLHAGDVTREKDPDGRDNIYGSAVNTASRISGLSAPGEVLVSETVRSLARTSAGVRFEDRGEQALKGVGEAVRVWAVRESE